MGCVVSSMEGLLCHKNNPEWLYKQQPGWWKSLEANLPKRNPDLYLYDKVQVSGPVMRAVIRGLGWNEDMTMTRVCIANGKALRPDFIPCIRTLAALEGVGLSDAATASRATLAPALAQSDAFLMHCLHVAVAPAFANAKKSLLDFAALVRKVLPATSLEQWSTLIAAFKAASIHLSTADLFRQAAHAADTVLMTALIVIAPNWVELNVIYDSITASTAGSKANFQTLLVAATRLASTHNYA
jgi:hypothetical protein